MAPSRGGLGCLRSVRLGSRPLCASARASLVGFPSRKPLLGQAGSFSSHQGVSKRYHMDVGEVAIEARGEESMPERSSSTHSNEGVNRSLFEASTEEYTDTMSSVKLDQDAWHSGPSDLLNVMLRKGTEGATATLKELKRLQTEVEPRSQYAQPARHCAAEGDYQGCLYWLDLIPKYADTDASLPERSRAATTHTSGVSSHLASTLRILVNSNMDPYIVSLALLKIVGKGYLEDKEDLGQAIFRTLTWLVRHGRVPNQDQDQGWSIQFFESLQKLALRAKAGNKKASTSQQTSELLLEDDMQQLQHILIRMYNGCIRTLALSGRFEAAILWVQNSDTFRGNGSNNGTRLQPFTWRVFLEEVLDQDSSASDFVRSQTGALAADLHAQAKEASPTDRIHVLVRVMRDIVIDRNAETVSGDASLDDQVADMLDRNDRRGAITVLHQMLDEIERTPRWGHLPKASTLLSLREAVASQGLSNEQEELAAYLHDLSSSRGSKGLVKLTDMLQLSQSEKHAECVSVCISAFDCRDLRSIALLVDEDRFRPAAQDSLEDSKLQENKYATYVAQKSLLMYCNNDFFKMQKVYRAFLDSASHHAIQDARDPQKSGDSAQSAPDDDGVFEETNYEYMLSGHSTPASQATGVKVEHSSTPNSRPTVSHFNLFLKLLPKALSVTIHRGSASARALLKRGDVHEQVADFAFDILKEMNRFRVEPNASTWSILLTLLTRNLTSVTSTGSEPTMLEEQRGVYHREDGNGQNRVEDDAGKLDKSRAMHRHKSEELASLSSSPHQYQWDRVWKLTRALGMGTEKAAPDITSALPRATALTYADLIYAFLMVPPSRGGPCLEQAQMARQWLQDDPVALSDVGRYQHRLQRVLNLLTTVEERERKRHRQRHKR